MGKQFFRKYLPELTYGGIDGSVTTFAIVSGSIGASLDSSVILILGFANLFADGFAMSVGAYLSSGAKDIQISKKERLYIAGATFAAFITLGFIPLVIYVLQYVGVDFSNPFLYASILTFISFAIIGYTKSFLTNMSYIKNISETMLLGASAAIVAYCVGNIIESII